MTLKQDIENYIKKKANSTSISRAKNYSLAFANLKNRQMFLTCRVSGDVLYKQTVDFSGGEANSIRTSCSCPYQGDGICKHAIAALRVFAVIIGELPAVISEDKTQNIRQKNEMKQNNTRGKRAVLKYPLVNNLIDFKAIITDFNEHGHHGSSYCSSEKCLISKFEENKNIKTKTIDYGNTNVQTFHIDDISHQLIIDCDCRKYNHQKTNHCDHILIAVKFLEQKMGSNCLQKDFFYIKSIRFCKIMA